MRSLLIIILAAALAGCGGTGEPAGKSVELTQADQDKVKWAHDAKELWAAWHTKGTRLFKEERYEEALFCFNQAMKAWPKIFEDDRGMPHQPEPGDTLLQKAYVFLALDHPKLAIKYFEKFDTYRPGTKVVTDGIAKAKALMKK